MRLRPDGAAPLLGCLGDICPQKGVDVLIEAFAIVARDRNRARLTVAGRVPDRFAGFKSRLDERIRQLGLTGRILFPGERPDPASWLEEIDILVHPSPRESFGRTAAEALLREVPVAAARSGGVEEIVREGETGYLVPAGDPDALAGAVLRLLAEPEAARRLAAAGRRAVESRFSSPRIAGEMEEEIRSVLRNNG